MKIKLVHKHLPGEHDQQSHTPKGYDGNETKTIPKYGVGETVLYSGMFMGRRVENKKAVISKEPEVKTIGGEAQVYYTMSIRAHGGNYNVYAYEDEGNIRGIEKPDKGNTDPNTDAFWTVDIDGTKYDLREGLEAKFIDKYEDVKETKFGKGYMLTGEDKMVDVSSEFGDGTNDHPGFIATSAAREEFGLTSRQARDFLKAYSGELGMEGILKGWAAIYKSGAIRVREFGNEIAIDVGELNTRTLKRLQRLYDVGKLGIKPGNKISIQETFGNVDYVNTDYEEFLISKYLVNAQLKEAKRLVFTYRPTNPRKA